MSEQLLLELHDVRVIYDQVILALRGVSLQVPAGKIVAVLGANGAGKSTTLKAASRLVDAEGGRVVAGSVRYQGEDISTQGASQLVDAGLVQVLEGRHCFAHLTVEQNLIVGALVKRPSSARLKTQLERVYHFFPRLRERRHSKAGYTSGGEQQMLAIGRALMADPKLVLLDEPSMGLAPLIVEEIFQIVQQLNRDEGVSFLLAEQNATLALHYADHAFVLENGRVTIAGTAAELATRPDVSASYLGGAAPSFAKSHETEVASAI